jgi:hypothetical protein
MRGVDLYATTCVDAQSRIMGGQGASADRSVESIAASSGIGRTIPKCEAGRIGENAELRVYGKTPETRYLTRFQGASKLQVSTYACTRSTNSATICWFARV